MLKQIAKFDINMIRRGERTLGCVLATRRGSRRPTKCGLINHRRGHPHTVPSLLLNFRIHG